MKKYKIKSLTKYTPIIAILVYFIYIAPLYSAVHFDSENAFISKSVSEGDDCVVHYVTIDEKPYVLKKIKSDIKEDQIALVHEKIVSDIAQQLKIPIPNSFLVFHSNSPAILQELAQGK